MTRSASQGQTLAGRVIPKLQFSNTKYGAGGTSDSQRVHWTKTFMAKGSQPLKLAHVRFKPVAACVGVMHCVLLDCSASMMGAGQLAAAKGVLLQITQQVYRQRDELSVISFAGENVQVLHEPHKTDAASSEWIKPIAGGGGTPIQLAVQTATDLLQRHSRRKPAMHRVLWLLSDARFHPLPELPRHVDESHVVDFESNRLTLGRVRQLATLWQANYTSQSHWTHVTA